MARRLSKSIMVSTPQVHNSLSVVDRNNYPMLLLLQLAHLVCEDASLDTQVHQSVFVPPEPGLLFCQAAF